MRAFLGALPTVHCFIYLCLCFKMASDGVKVVTQCLKKHISKLRTRHQCSRIKCEQSYLTNLAHCALLPTNKLTLDQKLPPTCRKGALSSRRTRKLTKQFVWGTLELLQHKLPSHHKGTEQYRSKKGEHQLGKQQQQSMHHWKFGVITVCVKPIKYC